jgi:hypothetical protein
VVYMYLSALNKTREYKAEVSRPRCIDKLYNQINVFNIWSEQNYILSHRLVLIFVIIYSRVPTIYVIHFSDYIV